MAIVNHLINVMFIVTELWTMINTQLMMLLGGYGILYIQLYYYTVYDCTYCIFRYTYLLTVVYLMNQHHHYKDGFPYMTPYMV